MNLNEPNDFNVALQSAINFGILHTGTLTPRISSEKLMNLIAVKHGSLAHRRFHIEILNRAYGLAFINQKKMNWVKAREE